MLRPLPALALVLFAVLCFSVLSSYKGDEPTETKNQSSYKDSSTNNEAVVYVPQSVHAVSLPASASFAGEALPLDNFDAKERLDRELLRNSYYHSNTILNIKRTKRFFPIIEKILAEEGLPDDFKYLAVAESDLSNATSPAGAKGVWQFMKGTAKQYGMTVNSEVDERYHLDKSTRAACKYLKSLKNRFGSWTMAAAAYNVGGSRLNKVKTEQLSDSYFDLNLNAETGRYVFRIVALKEILSNPSQYGFLVQDHQKYEPLTNYYEVELSEQNVKWAAFAKKHGTTYRMLKVYNPWLIASKLTNKSKRKYLIRIPN